MGAVMKERLRLLWATAFAAFILAVDASFVEDLDESFKENRKDDIWLVDVLPRNLEFRYPTIKLLKGDLAYNYRGPRTKDDIIEFANRVAGPIIRYLPSQQMFEHVQKRHRIFFLYIGGESPLKYVTLPEMPAVLVFKDGTYFVYDEYEDGDLTAWINRERFQGYLNIDGFTLYELGDTGKLVAIAVIDDKDVSAEHGRLKSIVQEVAKNYRDHFHRNFQFGHMDGNEYINSLLMDDLKIPTLVVLNTSNQQYFLPHKPIESTEDLVQFINDILEGTAEAYGGDGILQRIKRIIYDAKSTVGVRKVLYICFQEFPLLGCFLFGLPLGVISIMCYGICTADTEGGSDEAETSKKETTSRDLTDEGTEEEQEEEYSESPVELPERARTENYIGKKERLNY